MAFSAKKIFGSFVWRFLEQSGAQIFSFITTTLLMRALAPEIFGLMALALVFTSIMGVFVNCGFSNALIQKKDADRLDFSSVTCFTACSGFLLMIVMMACSPFIARFYERPELTPIICVVSVTFLFNGLVIPLNAHLTRTLQFQKTCLATYISTIVTSGVAIAMAYCGLGIWALVAQTVLGPVVNLIVLWIALKWKPSFRCSKERLKSLYSYGGKMLYSSILDTVYGQLHSMLIGVKYKPADLAFYQKGAVMPDLVVNNINSSINSVLLPTMSAEQDNRDKIRDMLRISISVTTYLMMPVLMFVGVAAYPLVRLIFTEEWLFCVPFMQIFCFTRAFMPIHTNNLSTICAVGRTDYFFKLEIVKKIVGFVTVISTVWFGVLCMAWGGLVGSILNQIVNAYPNAKLIKYPYWKQLLDIMPNIIITVITGAIISLVYLLKLDDLQTVIIQGAGAIIVYVILSIVARNKNYLFLAEKVRAFRMHHTSKAGDEE